MFRKLFDLLHSEPVEPVVEEKSTEELIEDTNRLMLLAEVKQQAEQRGDDDTVQAVIGMTYNGPLPIIKPDGEYTCIYNPLWDFNIAGINYRKGIVNYVGEFIGYIEPEPTNKYDPDAIAIYHADGHHLGYIPSNYTQDIREQDVQFPLPVFGYIEECYDDYENRRYFRGTVYIEIPDHNATHPYNPRTL